MERGMYVRCSVSDFEDPRNFITGKILETDDFTENVSVAFLDPFGFRNYYENIPEKAELPYEYVKRSTYVYGAGLISEEEESSQSGTTTYRQYHYNNIGSTIAVTGQNGQVTAHPSTHVKDTSSVEVAEAKTRMQSRVSGGSGVNTKNITTTGKQITKKTI